VDYLKRFGFTPSQLPPGLSLALGTALVTPLQMAQAFAVFANSGFKVTPFAIDTIRNSHDELIYQARPLVACEENCEPNTVQAPRTISADNAFLITSALRDVIQHGTAAEAKKLGREDLAGKTGTTQNQVDAWFAGYNPDLVAVTWVGFDSPQSLHEYGSQAALPMWMDFIRYALKGKPEHMVEQPPGIVSMRIDADTGKRVTARDPNAMFEYFIQAYAPKEDGPGDEPEQSSTEDLGDGTAQDDNAAPAPAPTAANENTENNNVDDGSEAGSVY
jgi:penicillin-binding protein 1A